MCLFHIFSPVNVTLPRSDSTNACDASGSAAQDMAASTRPVTATPSHVRK